MTPEEIEKHRLSFRDTYATTGHDMLKALLIVSGGSAVAYLTFLGSTFAQDARFKALGPEAIASMISAMRLYIFGVAIALLCHGFTWFSHGCYYFNFEKAGHAMAVVAVGLGFACLGCFLWGSLEAAAAFSKAASHMLKP